ncbi:uncharacterized protein VTP21DRAFT_9982 [Calcarisporiella thermophila]|uniref:uncharacterized protein n=1 Tax=Calcarisporiella thermophila TaxID=911321 RepID=UPI00374300DB
MGASASKHAARQFPRGPKPEPLQRVRENPATPSPQESHRATLDSRVSEKALAQETKDESIQQENVDPQFLENLAKIGQVQVHNPTISRAQSSKLLNIVRNRQKREEESAEQRDRLTVSALRQLLEQRSLGVEKLASAYNLEKDTVKNLLERLNTYPAPQEDLDEPELAVWIEDHEAFRRERQKKTSSNIS